MLPETVLVTGAGGFIGSNLVDDQLSRGRRVIALDVNLDKLKHRQADENCSLVIGDVRDYGKIAELMKETDIVFHLASAHLEVSKSDDYFWETNVNAVKELLKMASDNNIKRFVHCSTVGVYGPLKNLPASEETLCHPDILYEETKLAGEKAVKEHVEKTGLSAVILRPAWVYGPRCPRTLKLFRTIGKRRFFMVGQGENMRHPIYISDMLEAFELAATNDNVKGKTYLIASDEPVKLQNLISDIIEAQNMKFKPLQVPFFVMTPVCIVVESIFKIVSKEPPFSTRSLKFFTESSAFDISKAKNELGFAPVVGLKDGLAKTYQFYKKENLL